MKKRSSTPKNTSVESAQQQKIKIMGQSWTLREISNREMSALGLCHTDIYEIWLNDSCLPEVRRNTFLHEILHALSYVGQLRMTERQVDVLATLLIALARDNPELIDYFFKEKE